MCWSKIIITIIGSIMSYSALIVSIAPVNHDWFHYYMPHVHIARVLRHALVFPRGKRPLQNQI